MMLQVAVQQFLLCVSPGSSAQKKMKIYPGGGTCLQAVNPYLAKQEESNLKAMWRFLENTPSDKKIHHIKKHFFNVLLGHLMKIDTVLYPGKKQQTKK
jgi:hypothetical protein